MYVDGFLLSVPKKNIKAYKAMAEIGRKVWMKYGALDYKECIGDDLKAQWGVSFSKVARAKKGEVIFFSYILFKSRAHRDAVNKKVMADTVMNDPKWKDKPMPFDPKRMAYGGFKVLVSS